MALWHLTREGTPERITPSQYVFDDMDADLAHAVLGRLLDVLWITGKLSDAEIVEILGLRGVSTQPGGEITNA